MTNVLIMLSQFDEEIEGVKEYLRCAAESGDDSEVSTAYVSMAKAEFEHAKTLTTLIGKKLKKEMDSEEAKDILLGYLNDRHEQSLEDLAKAKMLIDMSR